MHNGVVRLDAISDEEDNPARVFKSSSLIGHVAFKSKSRTGSYGRIYTPYLRPPSQDLAQTPAEDTLEDNPIAAHTFAIFPPVCSVRSMLFDLLEDEEDPLGVTIQGLASKYAES